MKTQTLRSLTVIMALLFGWQFANAQGCTIGTGSYTWYGTYYPGCGSYTQTPTSFGPGQYLHMPMRSGGSYTINTCGNGTYQGYDTQITVRTNNNATYLGYNDDSGSCGSMPLNSFLSITGTVNEFVKVGVKRYNCQVNSGGSTSIYVRLRQNNNLGFPGGSACESTTVNLGATPSRTSNTTTGSHRRGYYSGTGTQGNVGNMTTYNDWTAPSVSTNTSYTLTYHFGACTVNATWTSNALPNSIATLSGTATPCTGIATPYSCSSSGNATSYQWSLPSGWSGSSSTSTILVTAGTGSGTIQVRGVNSCGSGPWKSISVSAITTVGPPSFVTGNASPCSGSTYTYSVSPVAGATSYQWTLPSGWSGSSTGVSISATASGTGGNVVCRAVNSCGAGTAANFAVSPLTTPAMPSAISGDATPCIGGTYTYTVTNVSGLTYNWSFPSGWTVNSGTGTNSINVTTSSSGGTISVTASNACFTGPARTLGVSMTDVIGPPGAIAGNTAPCQGVATIYSISAVSGASSYSWTLPAGWTGSSTGLSISATNNGSPGTVSVAAVNDCGTGPNSNLSVDPVLNPVTPGAISGNTVPCVGGSYTYSVAAVPEATSYNWSLPAGWTGSSSTNSITVTAGSSGGTISVSAANSCSTSSAQTLSVTTQDVVGPPGAITGETSPCEGTAYTYSISPVAGATSYSWSAPAGWSGTSTGTSISYTPTSGASSGNVTVQAVNICGAGPSSTLAVAPLSTPAAPSAISGSTTPCNGQTYTYSVTNVPGLTYNWSLPAGWTGSSSTNSINVTVGPNPGTISVTATNICPFTSASSSLFITPDDVPATPGTISGDNTPCTGNVETYSIAAVSGASSYEWLLPSGWTGTSTTTSINVTVGTGTGSIQVRGVNGCGNGAYQTLSVTAITTLAGTTSLSGETAPCVGSTYAYSATAVSGATSYLWTLPSGWTGSSTGLTINATASSTAGNVTVQAVNDCGNGTPVSLAVTPVDAPATPGSISGDVLPCIGGSYTYSITAVPGATSYNWTLPAGWTGASTTNSINVTVGATGGTISVTASNACFTSSAQTLAVGTQTVLGAPGAITGSATPCEAVATTYSIAPVAGATSYQWTLPAGWTGSSTSLSISATPDGTVGTVSVQAVNICGAGAASTLSVDPILNPVQPDPIAGNLVPCVGAVETYSVAAVPEATSYNWTLPAGWSGTSSTNSINATVGTSGGTISVTATNSCSTGPARTLAVTTQDVIGPPGAITGEASPCIGTAYTYSISPVAGASSYQWTLPSGWSGTSTTTTISATAGATAGNVTVQAVNICGAGPGSDLATTPITTPAVPSAITGPNPACTGQVNTYTCTAVPTATTYNWTYPAGWVGPATTATNSVNVTPSTTAGFITVSAENVCGTSATQNLLLPVSDIPVASFTAAPFGVTATFTDNSTFSPTSWLWDFGDGSGTSTDQNPFYYYGTGGTFSVCLTATNSCGTSVTTCQNVVIPDYFDYIWNGSISTDWETGGNWSSGIVPFGDNVIIPNVANDPVISSGQIALVNNVTMNSGATITINGTGELHVTGNWDWPGTHTVNGLVIFDGFIPQPQSIDFDVTFENLRIENSVTLNGYSPSSAAIGITGGLTVDGGDLVTLGNLTILSDASGTGWINPLVNGGTITGDVTMQRYIPNGGYHYIGSPVTTPLLAVELAEYSPSGVDGAQLIPSVTCSSDTLAQGSPWGSILEFNESNNFFSSSCPYWGWNVRSSGVMTDGRGYAARNTSALTVDITGTINEGVVSYPGLGNSGGTYSGFHIVSNPYPSPMTWTPPAGFSAFMYAWQTSGPYAGTYQSFTPGTSVASMQGFFAKVSSGTASYTVNNSMRTTGDPTFWRTPAPFENYLEITVSKDDVADKTTLVFNDDATEGWDDSFDGMKLPGNSDRLSLHSRLDDMLYNVNSLPSIRDEKIIPLGFTCGDAESGVFDFEFTFRSDDRPIVYFIDNKAGTKTLIGNGTKVSINSNDGDALERFSLHFNPSADGDIYDDGLNIFNQNNSIVINANDDMDGSVIEVFDVLGNLVYSNEPAGNAHNVSCKDWTAGIYVVRVSGEFNGRRKLFIR